MGFCHTHPHLNHFPSEHHGLLHHHQEFGITLWVQSVRMCFGSGVTFSLLITLDAAVLTAEPSSGLPMVFPTPLRLDPERLVAGVDKTPGVDAATKPSKRSRRCFAAPKAWETTCASKKWSSTRGVCALAMQMCVPTDHCMRLDYFTNWFRYWMTCPKHLHSSTNATDVQPGLVNIAIFSQIAHEWRPPTR